MNQLYKRAQQSTEDPENRKDRFRVRYMVERNANNIYLDFHDEDSSESALKQAIFNKQSKTVSAVGVGLEGVGTTCALRGVALHKDAKERFPGGILYTKLGVKAGRREIVNSLAMFVRETGGEQKAKDVENAGTLSSSIACAADWFGTHSCLFLIDNISYHKDVDESVTRKLSCLAGHANSKVAFTTRDSMFHSDDSVTFHKRREIQAQKMLLLIAGVQRAPYTTEELSELQSLLKMASGLPIVINVIGGLAKYLKDIQRVNYNTIWSTVRKHYEQSTTTFHDETDALPRRVLMASVNMMEIQSNDNTFHQRFAELCIIGKRQEISLDVLQRIWGLSTEETQSSLDVLARFGMVEISTSEIGGQVRDCIAVHDMVLDLSMHLASREEYCIEETSRRVLESYVLNRYRDKDEGSSFKVGQSSRSWYGRKAEIFRDALIVTNDDGFIHGNVFRLLRSATLFDSGLALLSDPRWLMKHMKACHWKQVDDDIALMLLMLEEVDLQDEKDDVKTFLEMIRCALTESERHIAKNMSAEVFMTHMYGRLYTYRRYPGIAEFLARVEVVGERSWVKSDGAISAAQPWIAKVLDIADVRLLEFRDSVVDIISFYPGKRGFRLSQYCTESDVLKVGVKEWLPQLPWLVFFNVCDCKLMVLSNDRETFAVAISAKLVVFQMPTSCGDVGHSNEQQMITLGSSLGSKISALAISSDGCTIVCGSKMGRVTAWRKGNAGWTQSVIGNHRHLREVRSVSVNDSGTCVVSGSNDLTVTVWDIDGRHWNGCTLQTRKKLGYFAISRCASLVLTCDPFGIGVALWTKDDGVWKSEKLPGRCRYSHQLAVSSNKEMFMVGRESRYVNRSEVVVFRRADGLWKENVLEEYEGSITSFSMSADSRKVASAFEDGTVRVLHVPEGSNERQWQTSDSTGQTSAVRTVALTASRVVSAQSKNVTIWSLREGQWEIKSIEVDIDVWEASLSNDGRKLKLKGELPTQPESSIEEIYFIGHDDAWFRHYPTVVERYEFSVQCTARPGALPRTKWPQALSQLCSRIMTVYQVPGGPWLAVCMYNAPYFGFVEIINSKS